MLSVGEPIASDHNGDETCDLGNGSSEKGLNRSESSIKGRSALRQGGRRCATRKLVK